MTFFHFPLIFTLKLILFTYLIYHYSFILSILSMISVSFIYSNIMKYIFKLEALYAYELGYFLASPEEKNILCGVFLIDNLCIEEIKNLFINKGIKNHFKLRSKIVNILGDYYWKEFNIDEAKLQVKSYDDKILKTRDDVIRYGICIQKEIFNNEDSFLYEIHLMKYGNNGTALVAKFDHTISDAMGVMSFIISIADNYDTSLFPSVMRKKFSFFHIILLYISSPYYMIVNIIRNLSVKENLVTPFQKLKNNDTNQDSKKKVNEESFEYTISKNFSFDKVSKVAKKYGMSFNDLIVSVTSKVVSRIFEKYKGIMELSNLESFNLLTTVSMRQLPENSNEATFSNETLKAIFCGTNETRVLP